MVRVRKISMVVALALPLALAGSAAEQGEDAAKKDALKSQEQVQQRIQQDLKEAGLSAQDARQHAERLARDVQELRDQHARRLETIRDGYVEALSRGDTPRAEAQQQAQRFFQELELAQIDAGVRGASNPGSEASEAEIRQHLQQAGLDEQAIQRLEQRDFPQREVREAVQEAQTREGGDAQQAQQRAREVAQRVEELKTKSGQEAPGAVSAAPSKRSGADASPEEKLREHLERAGVEPQQIQELERQQFPKERVQQAVRQAQERQAQEIAQMADRLRTQGGTQTR